MNENEIKAKLGIKDWRNLSKDVVMKMLPLLKDASPETIKAILNQIPELTTTIKEINENTKEFYNNVANSSKNITQETISSINMAINDIKKMLDSDENLTFENKQWLIEKEVELIKMIKEINTEDKQFLAFLANNWKQIAAGSVFLGGCLFLCLTDGGREVLSGFAKAIKSSKDVAKIAKDL